MLLPILAFTSLMSFASDRDAFEKTRPRDNAFCQIGKVRLEIMLRGDAAHTEPNERKWGEHVFAKTQGVGPYPLPVNQNSGLYRFFPGNPSACSKTVGTKIGTRFAIFFQKLNNPHEDQLVIQYLDLKTLKPIETHYTNYLSDEAIIRDKGVLFRAHSPHWTEANLGRIKINESEFIYQDHLYPQWVFLDKNGFKAEVSETFERFKYRIFFNDQKEFERLSAWDNSLNKFNNTKLFVATNRKTQTRCLQFAVESQKTPATDGWLCKTNSVGTKSYID